MSTIYREFQLTGTAVWRTACTFIAANAKACFERGRPLRLIVTEGDRKRTTEMNRFYWGGVLSQVAEQAWVAGRRYDKDVWHEHFARKFGVCDEVVLPDGEIVTRRKSTTQMTVREFSEYLQRVQADATQELGVQFDD